MADLYRKITDEDLKRILSSTKKEVEHHYSRKLFIGNIIFLMVFTILVFLLIFCELNQESPRASELNNFYLSTPQLASLPFRVEKNKIIIIS